MICYGMFAHIGFYLLLLSLGFSFYGFLSAIACVYSKDKRFYISSKLGSFLIFFLTLLMLILISVSIFKNDYSFLYIYKNSNNELPSIYKISVLWSSLEGSHLLWTFILAVISMIVHNFYNKPNEYYMPYVSATIYGILTWMFFISINSSDPFLLNVPIPNQGIGLNPLLQNFYMIIHPPILFIGYSALIVPYSYSVAAMFIGYVNKTWLYTIRKWVVFSWIFLGIGIFLGAKWAYVELGWGGYWVWDPVENSSLVPWLILSALIHSLLLQIHTDQFKKLNIILSIFPFFFSIFGTFITRSNIIDSVHSFTQSGIGISYLLFISILLGFPVLFFINRSRYFISEKLKINLISKESSYIFSTISLVSFAILVFVGTIFPILSEIIDSKNKISVSAPYFNFFASYFAIALIISITLSNLSIEKNIFFKRDFIIFYLLVNTLIFIYLIFVLEYTNIFQNIVFSFGISGIFVLLLQILKKYLNSYNLFVFLFRNNKFFGHIISHVGVILLIIGVFGNYNNKDTSFKLQVGESYQFDKYKFSLNNPVYKKNFENYDLYTADIKIDSKSYNGILSPGKSRYLNKNEFFNEIAIGGNFLEDVYIVLSKFDKDLNQVVLSVYINQLTNIVWISVYMIIIGGILSFFKRYKL